MNAAIASLEGKFAYTTLGKKEDDTLHTQNNVTDIQDTVPDIIPSDMSLVENMELRQQLISRTDVLDKVKKLFLIPGIEAMTTQQVAEFYEVDQMTIRQCYNRNKDEISEDGVSGIKTSDFRPLQNVTTKNLRGKKELNFGDFKIEIPYIGSINLFSKRAVLRIGMLLRDSDVAREVRTQLLNTFEEASEEQSVKAIEEEKSINADMGAALMSGDINALAAAVVRMSAYKNRHIEALEKAVAEKNGYIASIRPKLKTIDHINSLDDSISMSAFAKMLSRNGIMIGRSSLFAWLRQRRYLQRNNEPYQQFAKYFNYGHAIVNDRWVPYTRVRGNGVLYFARKMLEEKGYLREYVRKVVSSIEQDFIACDDRVQGEGTVE